MSRAFVNEDDQRESPFIPPRADLPDGFPNYVTPAGMEALLKEKENLLAEQKNLVTGDEHDKQNAISVINTKLQMLENRIVSAQVIQKESSPSVEVRFGSAVTLQIGGVNKTQQFQIVGVDEADLKQGKIAFTSPLARLLMQKHAGESVTLKLAQGDRVFKIIEID
jgi:transcription elongation factor GreB